MACKEEHVGQVERKQVAQSKKCSVVCKEPGKHVCTRMPMGVVHGCRMQKRDGRNGLDLLCMDAGSRRL